MNVVEIINEAIASGRTRFAFELLPPLKGDGMQKIFAAVEPLMALDPAYHFPVVVICSPQGQI